MTTGTTRNGFLYGVADVVAAMEPRRDDGDDWELWQSDALTQMEPQWSPVVTTGTTRGRGRPPDRVRSCRNGAPS